MEHLEGQTLADRLGKGPLPSDEVFRYALQISRDGGSRSKWRRDVSAPMTAVMNWAPALERNSR